MSESTTTPKPSKTPRSKPAVVPALPKSPAEAGGKLGIVISLLRQETGASLADLMQATGWQAHSVRGAIAGAIKVKRGLTVTSEKSDEGRVYRIVEAVA